jgi:squalene-associated FAD-dependent desaturase
MKSVSIIGAGWAGLAAAVELTRHDIPVTVYESARHVGGRACTLNIDGVNLDNGQHLMIGAYRQILLSLQHMGVNPDDVLLRLPQHLKMLDARNGHTLFELKLPRWPAPLHLLTGMLTCSGLSWREKIRTLIRFNRLLQTKIEPDVCVEDWLAQAGLPPAYIDYLLKPLCLAALTSHTNQASARSLQNVLRETFLGPREHTDLLIPRATLGEIFPQAAVRYIESRGSKVLPEHRVSHIDAHNKILTIHDQAVQYEQLILATPASVTQKLLEHDAQFDNVTHPLQALQHQPVCTIYLRYPPHVELPLPMLGCVHGQIEWLFDRRHCRQPGLIAAVISGDGAHMQATQDELAATVSHELGRLFPHWPQPESVQVIREKRACFLSHVDIDRLRPGMATADPAIRLCGDYVYIENATQPGLPATLEGAVRSGVKCAQRFIEDRP